MNLIIDKDQDSTFATEIRDVLGTTSNELSDTSLKSDIILGAAERAVCKIHVPNWQAVLNGDDPIAANALRACVIIKVCLNIINTPAIQNILIDQVRLVDIIITAKKVTLQELKDSLQALFEQQLASVGVEYSGGYPERELVEKTGTDTLYEYYVDSEGTFQKY
jgi:hypothetical protein